MERQFSVPVGFSDHSFGIEAAPLAVAAGAATIEKHITLDRARSGFDHRLSLLPDEFAAMVAAIRRAERMLGSAAKAPTSAESESAPRYHRMLAARRDLAAGEILGELDLGFLRLPPGSGGLAPDRYWSILGRRLKQPVPRYGAIGERDLE